MNRAIWLTVAALVAFGAIVVARLPASWLVPTSKSDVQCTDVSGTVWNATCTGLLVQRQPVGDLTWDIHAGRLLAGKLGADLVLTRANGSARGYVEAGLGQTLTARDLHVDLPLDPALMPQLPSNLTGHLHADIAALRVAYHRVRSIIGRIEARDLRLGIGGTAEELGSYQLTFPATGGTPVGQLGDLGGPLEVRGTLTLTPEPGFSLQSQVRPRPSASAELSRDIQFLGSPDSQGWRPFLIAGTF